MVYPFTNFIADDGYWCFYKWDGKLSYAHLGLFGVLVGRAPKGSRSTYTERCLTNSDVTR